MINVINYDTVLQELQAKRKYLDEDIQNMINQNENKINQALIKLTTEQLKQLKSEKQSLLYEYLVRNSQKQKYTDYMNQVNEILERNRKSQLNFNMKEDKLYQIKTSLQPELLACIPSVGLRHKRLLQQEQVDVKIRRHKNQNEERLRQQQFLRGRGDQEMKEISQNLSKYAKNNERNSPQQEDNFENGSLVMSKSFNQSQQRQIQQQSQQFPENQTPVVQKQFQQKLLRGQVSSKLQYDGYDEEDDDLN
ncbi:unnamed protein product [Paramecium sonneborni]|uniref:Uncharacterized protein n=1 Tax=Paramecium sonneborni TaxID=65129 RepID=A0A8S1NNM8_9CILI|nr:unnamed protein product [Paramecium sonneborni]